MPIAPTRRVGVRGRQASCNAYRPYTLLGHVRVRVMDEGDLALLVCPAEGCREPIALEGVEEILQQDQDVAGRYRQLLRYAKRSLYQP